MATGNHRLAHTRQLLELRKLEIEVAVLRAQHPELDGSVLDGQTGKLLNLPDDAEEHASTRSRGPSESGS